MAQPDIGEGSSGEQGRVAEEKEVGRLPDFFLQDCVSSRGRW